MLSREESGNEISICLLSRPAKLADGLGMRDILCIRDAIRPKIGSSAPDDSGLGRLKNLGRRNLFLSQELSLIFFDSHIRLTKRPSATEERMSAKEILINPKI